MIKYENSCRAKKNNYTIEIIDFNLEMYKEHKAEVTKEYNFKYLGDIPDGITRWINVDGQYTEKTLEKLTEIFNIHPLVSDDILNNSQRAKVEDYEDYLYIVAKMIYYCNKDLILEHVSFILGKNYVISFGEIKGDVFDNIRNKLKNEGTQIRKLKSDFLIYSLLDSIVSGYFDVLDIISDKIDAIEENVMVNSSQKDLHDIREIKKNLLAVYKYVWPLREVTSWMGNDSTDLIRPTTELYIRDLFDHILQVVDATNIYRELLSDLTDLYVSNTSYRLNEVMKVLTIISTIFIPLTFIAGVYGMNFKYMPELQYRWGYGITWVVMIIIAILMGYFFKKKKWF